MEFVEGETLENLMDFKSTGSIALHVRQVVCVVFRFVYDPRPVPAGLHPNHNLHRPVGVFLDVADRELLGLNFVRFLLSQIRVYLFWLGSASLLVATRNPPRRRGT
jgi:hypothetical protein